jgi:hypothetical protein
VTVSRSSSLLVLLAIATGCTTEGYYSRMITALELYDAEAPMFEPVERRGHDLPEDIVYKQTNQHDPCWSGMRVFEMGTDLERDHIRYYACIIDHRARIELRDEAGAPVSSISMKMRDPALRLYPVVVFPPPAADGRDPYPLEARREYPAPVAVGDFVQLRITADDGVWDDEVYDYEVPPSITVSPIEEGERILTLKVPKWARRAVYEVDPVAVAVAVEGYHPIERIALAPSELDLAYGASVEVEVVGTDDVGAERRVDAIVTSRDVEVATLVCDGGSCAATGRGEGTTKLVAEYRRDDGRVLVAEASVAGRRPTLVTLDVVLDARAVPLGRGTIARAIGTYQDGSLGDVTSSATWSSTSEATATVSAEGAVASVAVGTTRFIASFEGRTGESADFTVGEPVVDVIDIDPAVVRVPVGRTQSFDVVALYSDGASVDHSDDLYAFFVEDAAIARVTGDGAIEGLAQGQTVVTARFDSATEANVVVVPVEVEPAALTSIALLPSSLVLAVGQTSTVAAVGTYSDGSSFDVTDQVSWVSTDPLVCEPSEAGRVLGVGVGSAELTASMDGVAATMEVTVDVP